MHATIQGMIETLLLAFTIGLTGALAPGPTLVATADASLKSGWSAGPKVAFGHAAVELMVFLMIVAGLAAALQPYSRAIAVIGGTALIAFGALTVLGSRSASISSISSSGRGVAGSPFAAGVITSAANPYFWIWWLSVGSAFVIEGLDAGLMMAGLFMIGHWGADFGWYTLVSLGLDRGRTILSVGSYRRALAACGIFLILFGALYLSGAWVRA